MELVGRKRHLPRQAAQRRNFPIAEVTLAGLKRSFQWQKTQHFMAGAIGIDHAFAECHVATAFAINQLAAIRRGQDAVPESICRCQLSSMKLGITARQKNCVGIRWCCFISKRREKLEPRTLRLPELQQMRIGKGKGNVPGNGNALAKRCGQVFPVITGRPQRYSQCFQAVQVDMPDTKVAGLFQEGFQIWVFSGLDKPKMAFR